MSNIHKIELGNLEVRRQLLMRFGIAILSALIVMSILVGDWKIGAVFLGAIGLSFLIAITIIQLQGILLSIEINGDDLSFNYGYLLSNQENQKIVKLHTIKKAEYSEFLTRLTIESTSFNTYVNIQKKDNKELNSFLDILNKEIAEKCSKLRSDHVRA